MKTLILIAALCTSSVAAAETKTSFASPHKAAAASDRADAQLAIKERMGQLQLNMLIDSIVSSDEKAENVTNRSAGQAVASIQR